MPSFGVASILSPACWVIAQQGNLKGMTPEDREHIFFWLGVLVAVAIITGITGFVIYRRLKKAQMRTEEEEGFSLSQMRRLYEAGEISHEEYTQLRQKLLASSHQSMLGDAASAQAKPVPPVPPLPPLQPVPPVPPVAAPEMVADDAADEVDSVTDDGQGSTPPAQPPPPVDHNEPPTDEELHPRKGEEGA